MIKPVRGSWFEFQHFETVEDDSHMAEGRYWNRPCREFTAEQWKAKIREMADIGFEYLVLMSIARQGILRDRRASAARSCVCRSDRVDTCGSG